MLEAPLRIENAPGLIWKRHRKSNVAYWQIGREARAKGYPTKTVRLWSGIAPTVEDREQIAKRCRQFHEELERWLIDPGMRRDPAYHGKGRVYFMADGEEVKIGFSIHPPKRMAQIQLSRTGELKILLAIPGTPDDEQQMHDRFAHLRIRGEWFRMTDELKGFIDGAKYALKSL